MKRSAIVVSACFLLLFTAALRCNGQAPPAKKPVTSRGKPVIEISHSIGMRDADVLDIPATAMRDGVAAPLPRVETSEPYRQPLANSAMNSRLDGVVAGVEYKQKWQSDLSDRIAATYTLRAGDRIMVQAPGVYQMFNLEGTSVAVNEFGSGGIVMDARPQMFYTASRNSDFVANRMADGTEQFNTPLTFGESFTRPLLARQGWRIVMVGVERPMYPHAPKPPNLAVIETKTMTAPIRLTSMRELLSVDSSESLIIKSSALQAAVSGEHLVFAVPGRIYFASINLRISNAYESDFTPYMMSVDENARAHMIVRNGDAFALWVVAPTGERQVHYALKAEYGNPIAPPVIGYDHRIYVLMRNHIVALSPDGKLLWETVTPGTVAGAGVTRDDHLLASVGAALVAYNASGTSHVVHEFKGDTLRTPPAMTDGEIVVASARHLYCLVR